MPVRKHVLIVDDHDSDLLYTRLVIERAGITQRVTTIDNARDALAFLQQPEGVDVGLILLDINMPGMDGFAFLRAFEEQRTDAELKAPVIVMLSSSPDPQDRERAFTFGCVRDYVTKPVSVDAMLQLVQRLESKLGRR